MNMYKLSRQEEQSQQENQRLLNGCAEKIKLGLVRCQDRYYHSQSLRIHHHCHHRISANIWRNDRQKLVLQVLCIRSVKDIMIPHNNYSKMSMKGHKFQTTRADISMLGNLFDTLTSTRAASYTQIHCNQKEELDNEVDKNSKPQWQIPSKAQLLQGTLTSTSVALLSTVSAEFDITTSNGVTIANQNKHGDDF